MATTPQITLTANLESILAAAANAGYLRITLCGYGPQVPAVPGTCLLADAGVPQMLGPQSGPPLSIALFGNDVIQPPNTFYEIAVLDANQDVIQCAMYQFTGSGTTDLSQAQQYLPPYGFAIAHLAYLNCAGSGTTYVAPGPVIAVTYNGIVLPQGTSGLSYTLSGTTITLNFTTGTGDRIDAFCIS